MKYLVYIHGFNSSSNSIKANRLKHFLTKCDRGVKFFCPDLSYDPQRAIESLSSLISNLDPKLTTLVGSSLGGFYATWLSCFYHVRAVLINPAIVPHIDLRPYLGKQKNYHSKYEYHLEEAHLKKLEELYVDKFSNQQLFFLIHTTGDKLLDWRVACDRFRNARQLIIYGDDHGFSEFPRYLRTIAEFAEV